MDGWIGVDLDGTLAYYDEWRGIHHVGAPIMPMCNRVREWLVAGKTVKIFTARVYCPAGSDRSLAEVLEPINKFSEREFDVALEVTNIKDFGMVELWDDRAVQVEMNTGREIK